MMEDVAFIMYQWAKDMFPICRSITGPGTRETLAYIKKTLPELEIREVRSGSKAFDWIVPDEWAISEAYVETLDGLRIIDYVNNNLHVVGYSEPVDLIIDLEELEEHLHSLPDLPQAIPYITSYYKRNWGFCLSHAQRKFLKNVKYHVVIKSELKKGVLNYAELILPGRTSKEVFISTYICHPSMANNELSGPVVTMALALWLKSLKNREYTYRIVFIPETIGSIVYISKNIDLLKKNTILGFNITCVGDNNKYSFLPTREGNTYSDQLAKYILDRYVEKYQEYSFLDRGSDERQYCSPLVDLPVVSVMRSKYGEYKEYHTSLDDLSFISPEGLWGAYKIIKKCLEVNELNFIYCCVNPCEPQLGRYGLYPHISTKESKATVKDITNVLAYCDGINTLLDISRITNIHIDKTQEFIATLIDNNLIKKIDKY